MTEATTEVTDAQSEQLKFLLADFSATKAEIARRSTLQRVVLVGFLAIAAVAFQQLVEPGLTRLWLLAVWVSAGMAFQFHARESMEIFRLGRIVIGERIAGVAGEVLGVDPLKLLPSETDAEYAATQVRRCRYDKLFWWVVYFGLPLGLSVAFAFKQPDQLVQATDWWSAPFFSVAFTVVGAIYCFALLKRHAWR